MLDAFANYYTEYKSFVILTLDYNESYNSFAEKFNKFVYLPWKTAEQMAERYEITKQFLEIIKFLYGIKATRYISQFL